MHPCFVCKLLCADLKLEKWSICICKITFNFKNVWSSSNESVTQNILAYPLPDPQWAQT